MAGEGAPTQKKVESVYTLALSRGPSSAEIKAAQEHIERQQHLYQNSNVPAPEAAARAMDG